MVEECVLALVFHVCELDVCVSGCGGGGGVGVLLFRRPFECGSMVVLRAVQQVIRSICILEHPVECVKGAESAQIILPQNQIGRAHGT